MARELDTSPLQAKWEKNHIQQIVATFLYYSKAVDSTILVDLGSIDANKSNRNETTAQAIKKLLDYCATHPYSKIRYKQSNVVLCVTSDGY